MNAFGQVLSRDEGAHHAAQADTHLGADVHELALVHHRLRTDKHLKSEQTVTARLVGNSRRRP